MQSRPDLPGSPSRASRFGCPRGSCRTRTTARAEPRGTIMESIGHVFGRWTVDWRSGAKRPRANDVLVRCACGVEHRVTTNDLRQSKSQSCGCANPRLGVLGMDAHAESRRGEGKTRLYIVWRAMKARCLDPNVGNFHNYGGRGIKVHPTWLEFVGFRDWIISNVGRPPSGTSFDRINNDGNSRARQRALGDAHHAVSQPSRHDHGDASSDRRDAPSPGMGRPPWTRNVRH